MDDKRCAFERGDGHARGEGHPVVRVHDVEGFISRDLGGECRVALDFVEEIAAVVIARLGSAGAGGSLLTRLLDEVGLITGYAASGAAGAKRLLELLGGL